MFPVPQNKTIPELEDEVLAFWKENKIFEKSVSQRSKENLYVFYDGPPFISGLPHYGHLLGSIAKDVVPRYFTMQGKRVERVWGWDAHGLTVENKVQKKLGIKDRKDIEAFGLEEFTNACYDYTSQISQEWKWYIDKVGRWVDMENAYKTIDQTYMESVLWVFGELYNKGLIYEGVRTSLYCTTCGTPVSNFEIAMDNTYKEIEDPAITVKFKITSEGDFKGTYILAWTTTPWTIPSNRALVVDPSETYVLFEQNDQKYIVAKKRLEYVADAEFAELNSFPGSELIGLEYDSPYKFYETNEPDFKVYAYEGMVNMEEGTGIVHSAPGFGEIDTEMERHYELSMTMAINDEGVFVADAENKNPFAGVFYKKADEQIIEDLLQKNLLFKNERVVHRFPYHDRCDTLLIQKAQNSWFIDVANLKDKMLSHNEKINWVPRHLKEGRFKQGIEQAPDWCISRTRFWATPMPIWEAADGDRIVISSIKELEELSGQKIESLHRPFIDKVVINKDGKEYKRRLEVLDSWFEAGSMPYAQLHYPFENKEKFEANFPGDYIVEYIAQVRAWFYVMHVLSTALLDSPSFKNVISTGTMSGSDGRKMSKTYQNYTDPKEVLEKVGGDALRLYLMNSPLMLGGNANFDETELKTKSRNVLNPLWNSLKFFLIYANQYNFIPNLKFNPLQVFHVLDRWILTRLSETIRDISTNIETYQIPGAVQPVEAFVDDLSRWYVRRSRERIAVGDTEALNTFHYVLLEFSKAAAPVIPFITESIYRVLRTAEMPESVHLCEYPIANGQLLTSNKDLLSKMGFDRQIASELLSIRATRHIPVRQALSGAATITAVNYPDIVKEEVNVKDLVDIANTAKGNWVSSETGQVKLNTEITEELRIDGLAREFVRKIQDLRKEAGLSVGDTINLTYENTDDNKKVLAIFGDEIKQKVMAQKLTPGKTYAIEKI